MNLHGTWLYQIGCDGDDFDSLPDFKQNNTFIMPGTTNQNKIGEPLDEAQYDEKESIKCLREKFSFIGVMWYQTTIDIHPNFLKEEVELYLERVMFESKLYVNGIYVDRDSSLSTPHRYYISSFLQVGKNTITLRINNQDVEHIGVYASAMTIDTQTIWNGIIGKMELRSIPKVRLSAIKIFPKNNNKEIMVQFQGINTENTIKESKVSIQASSTKITHKVQHYTLEIKDKKVYEVTYKMNGAIPWSEHDPNVYKLELCWDQQKYTSSFGLRTITTKNRQILINDSPTFFLGTLECCVFPLTGYPPTEREYWEKIYDQIKAYGLNHIRFHSWCPPEIAFDVADEYGVYLQVEAPLWLDRWMNLVIGGDEKHYEYIPKESKRIITEYGNHPSFVIFSNGNELNGDFDLLEKNIHDLKVKDERFLYTLTSNWDRPINKEDDIFIAQTVDGVGIRGQYFHHEMANATNLEFSKGIRLRDVPIITHEVGQYTIFPNIDEIPKYDGLLEPTNLKYIKKTLDEKGLFPLAKKYVLHSGKTSALLYRDEIESALRTKNLAGIQLLDIHDFPGQSTAHVGILDSFWDEKHLITSKRFREFSNRVVPLLHLKKRVYVSEENMEYTIQIANYLPQDLVNKVVTFKIYGEEDVFEKQIYLDCIAHGNSYEYFSDLLTLPSVSLSKTLECELSISDTEYQNRWKIHVMPQESVEECNFFTEINDEFYTAIKEGKNILYNPLFEMVKNSIDGRFFPVFWSPVHFTSDNPNGLIIPSNHNIFNHFKTDDFADYRWKNLLDNSVNMIITNKSIKPIIDVIPNFIVAERLTNLFDVQIGNSYIITTTMDITSNLDYRHDARTLRNSISKYLKCDNLTSANKMELEEFKQLFHSNSSVEKANKLRGMELGKGKPSIASSNVKEHPAYYGNNGLNYSFWAADNKKTGEYFEIDLEQERLIYGTKIVFEKEANYLYVIQVSLDGKEYDTVVNQTGQISTKKERKDIFTTKARYIRLVYNGLPASTRAGHYSFEIYGE